MKFAEDECTDYISHLPPSAILGTLILPVSVLVINTLSISKLKVTLPVVVLTKISAASEPSKFEVYIK